jgi:hypothetical protein
MQKAMVWAVAVALVWLGVQATPVNAQDVILIKVGPDLIDDPNKDTVPIPEVEFGEPFDVEVRWVRPLDDLSIALSDFRLVSFNPDADYLKGEVIWTWDQDFRLELLNENNEKLREMSFSFSEAQRDSEGAYTRKTMTLHRRGSRDGEARPQLILFKQTVKDGDTVLFVHDPPWVGKPPTG